MDLKRKRDAERPMCAHIMEFDDDTLLTIFYFLEAYERFLGRDWAISGKNLANVRLVARAWNRLILSDQAKTLYGFFPKEVSELNKLVKRTFDITPHGLLTFNEAVGMDDIAVSIAKAFPPEKNVFVSLGSSPSPLMIHFSGKYSEAAVVHLPMSGISVFDLYRGQAQADNERLVSNDLLTQDFLELKVGSQDLERVYRYIQNQVGNVFASNKNIVILDIFVSGQGLGVAKIIFKRMKDAHHPLFSGSITALALNLEKPTGSILKLIEAETGSEVAHLKCSSRLAEQFLEKVLQQEFKSRLLWLFDKIMLPDILQGRVASAAFNAPQCSRMLAIIRKARRELEET